LYDKRLGRWMIPDPARSHWSPYLAMGNNPIIFGDPDGRDIVILVAANGGMFGSGHMGMLIGSDATGWNYLSKEGTQGSKFRALVGGPPKPPELILVQKGEGYATIDDFFKDMPNLTNTYTDASQ